jgi:hypothetical protein
MADKARFHVVMPVATRARLNGLAADTGLAASALTRLAIDRLLAEPDPLGTKGTKMATITQESSSMAIAKAEAAFALAKIEAEGRRQASMAAAEKLPMPAHSTTVKAADRAFFLDLAQAAEASGGLIGSAGWRWHPGGQ